MSWRRVCVFIMLLAISSGSTSISDSNAAITDVDLEPALGPLAEKLSEHRRKRDDNPCEHSSGSRCYYIGKRCVARIDYQHPTEANNANCPKEKNCATHECEETCYKLAFYTKCEGAHRCRDHGRKRREPHPSNTTETRFCPVVNVTCMKPDGQCPRYKKSTVDVMLVGALVLSIAILIIIVVAIVSMCYAYVKGKKRRVIGRPEDPDSTASGKSFKPLTLIAPPSLTTTPADALVKEYAKGKIGETKAAATPKSGNGGKSIRSGGGKSVRSGGGNKSVRSEPSKSGRGLPRTKTPPEVSKMEAVAARTSTKSALLAAALKSTVKKATPLKSDTVFAKTTLPMSKAVRK